MCIRDRIEAVAAVVQCKSENLNDQAIEEWEMSIRRLTTSMDSVARMATFMVDNFKSESPTTQTATRPLKILCTLAGESIFKKYEENFDIILSADAEKMMLHKHISKENQSLEDWNNALNHAPNEKMSPEDKMNREDRRIKLKTKREHLLQDLKVVKSGKDNEQDENVILSLIFQLNQLLLSLIHI